MRRHAGNDQSMLEILMRDLTMNVLTLCFNDAYQANCLPHFLPFTVLADG